MRKITSIMLAVIMIVMTGCGNRVANIPNSENSEFSMTGDDISVSVSRQSIAEQNAPQEKNENQISQENYTFVEPEQSLFSGKVREVCTGSDGKFLVRADKLYLYDAAEGAVMAEASLDEYSNLRVFAYESGYVLVENPGQNDTVGALMNSTGGEKCICRLYDNWLNQQKEIVLSDLVSDEIIISLFSIDVSDDGNRIVFATLSNVYLYQVDDGSIEKVLAINENAVYGNRRLGSIEYLTFINRDSQVAFVGSGLPSGDGDAIPSYGTFDITGRNLLILGSTSYPVSDMLVGDGFAYLPVLFNKANGTCLKYNFESGQESIIEFQNSKEGKDGVYASLNGEYIATALLDGKLTLNIYDKDGIHLKKYVVEGLNEAYFYRIPQVVMCEDNRQCIVVLGGNQMDMDTEIVCFKF